jgi:hypothetical protein
LVLYQSLFIQIDLLMKRKYREVFPINVTLVSPVTNENTTKSQLQ